MAMTKHAVMGLVMSFAVVAWGRVAQAQVTTRLGPCGGDPEKNRSDIQQKIDDANPGDTLVLPPGVCVVARCGVAQGKGCGGVDGVFHASALYVGGKSQLTIVGADDGTSVLALDPSPPLVGGIPAYCGATYLLRLDKSSAVTLRGFTLDGANAQLPQDDQQCPKGGLSEHMFDLLVSSTTGVVVEQMKIDNAHGDGIYLIGSQPPPAAPVPTDQVLIRGADLYANNRAAITLQADVGHVTISGNTIRDSGGGGDIHFEPSGTSLDVGPHDVTISDNVIDRNRPALSVSMGGDAGLYGQRISFVRNVIRPEPGHTPRLQEGGCLQVYEADQVTITDNDVTGAAACTTLVVARATNVTIAHNTLGGYANLAASGTFVPSPVVDVQVRTAVQPADCKPAPTCNVLVQYPDQVTLDGNILVQHLPASSGIRVSSSEGLKIINNVLKAAGDRQPAGALPTGVRGAAVDITIGAPPLRSDYVYLNDRLTFAAQAVLHNQMTSFQDGIRLAPSKPGVTLVAGAVDDNRIDGPSIGALGIIIGSPSSSPFVQTLEFARNLFGCGFHPFGNGWPVNAFQLPKGQRVSGNVGALVPCGTL
jgi:hypothetical protein